MAGIVDGCHGVLGSGFIVRVCLGFLRSPRSSVAGSMMVAIVSLLVLGLHLRVGVSV
jgi:hypothetical protein